MYGTARLAPTVPSKLSKKHIAAAVAGRDGVSQKPEKNNLWISKIKK
jgi:hypothetical protein